MSRSSHLGPVAGRRRLFASLGTAVVLLAVTAAPAAGAAGPTKPAKKEHGSHKLVQAPTDTLPAATLRKMKDAKLRPPKGATSTESVGVTAAAAVDPIELRVLVLATKGDPNPNGVNQVPAGTWDYNLSTLTSAMDYIGVPYDVYKSTTKQLCVNGSWKINYSVNPVDTTCTSGSVTSWDAGVTADRLWDGGVHAYYQGVMQTNGTLSYVAPDGTFVASALTTSEWTALWTFEATFRIRSVSANTYPTSDFGLIYAGEDGNPTSAKWTAAGTSVFKYVNPTGSLPIANAWTYRATVDPLDTTTVPLLTDGAGRVLAVVHTYPTQRNRQVLALTFDSAGYLTHGQVLGYGLVNWVTKGLFLGERHAILDPQMDDIFIADSIWPVGTPCGTSVDDPALPEYRITGNDLRAAVNWQRGLSGTSRAVKMTFPFNGEGSQPGYTDPLTDTLTPQLRRFQQLFKWVNHTWTHQNLDAVDYATATVDEMQPNIQLAATFPMTTFSTSNLIQPDISGLTNPEFLRAAKDLGIKYLISDTSRTGDPATYGVNEGRYNALEPSILEIARYPVNLYFNVSTPQEWLAEDNCLYPVGAPFGHVDTYQQLLDRESTVLLRYLLQGHNRPLMFHQPNLRAYDGVRSLLGDLINATMAKYNQLVKTPLISPTMDQLGARQASRMTYNQALRTGGLSASIVPGVSITLTSQQAVVVPVTGLDAGTAYPVEFYGGQAISYVTLQAGQTVTLPLL